MKCYVVVNNILWGHKGAAVNLVVTWPQVVANDNITFCLMKELEWLHKPEVNACRIKALCEATISALSLFFPYIQLTSKNVRSKFLTLLTVKLDILSKFNWLLNYSNNQQFQQNPVQSDTQRLKTPPYPLLACLPTPLVPINRWDWRQQPD